MNWFDVVLGVVLVASVVNGFLRGFFSLSIGLIATVLGILLASWFYGIPAAWLAPYVKHDTFANLAGFLLILLGVQLAGVLLIKLLVKISKSVGLGWLDRSLGGAFGALRGIIIAIVLVMVFTAFPITPTSTAVKNSLLAPYVMESAQIMVYLTPHELRTGFEKNYGKIKEAWNKTIKEAFSSKPKPKQKLEPLDF
jgi:membrane protein required for colicin V production